MNELELNEKTKTLAEVGVTRVLIPESDIIEKIKQAGKIISQDYQGKKLLLVSVLKGSFVFMADLIRNITIPCELEFITLSSYHNNTTSSNKINLIKDLQMDVRKYHIIVVEDILDSGLTLSFIINLLKKKHPQSVKIYTLLDKPDRRLAEITVDCHSCFTIPNEFVVGYGLDYAENYRNLPYIGIYGESN